MTHTCPRRMNEFGPWERAEGLDAYEPNHGLIGQPRGCSFCGSMSPDDFMKHVRAGRPTGPTDKSYKVYVHEIPRDGDPTEPRVLSHSSHPFEKGRQWADLNDAERAAVEAYDNGRSAGGGWWQFTPWGETVEGKFYTAHLSPEQGHEFWALHQAGKVNWSYPLYRPIYLPGPSDEGRTS